MERRDFLKSAAAAAAAAGTTTAVAQAADQKPAAKKAETKLPGDIVIERPGSDFMVDVLKTLDFDYIATNPGSSFRSLHESLVNYGGNRKPEMLTCLHEESAVGMAHGYAKASGKPMAVMVHGTVGLQQRADLRVGNDRQADGRVEPELRGEEGEDPLELIVSSRQLLP